MMTPGMKMPSCFAAKMTAPLDPEISIMMLVSFPDVIPEMDLFTFIDQYYKDHQSDGLFVIR